MIEYFKISNFGPIKDEIELNFEASEDDSFPQYEVTMPDGKRLLKMAYIYGANASGKSTVLNALNFLFLLWKTNRNTKDDFIPFMPFMLREDPNHKHGNLECSFYIKGVRHIYKLDYNIHSIYNEQLYVYLTPKPSLVFNRTTDSNKRLSQIKFGSNFQIKSETVIALQSNVLHNNTVIGAYFRLNLDIPILENIIWWSHFRSYISITPSSDLIKLSLGFLEDKLVDLDWIQKLMNKADPGINKLELKISREQVGEKFKWSRDSIPFEDPRKIHVLFKYQNKDYDMPFNMQSEGTKRYFGLATVMNILLEESGLAIIDELDDSLHEDLLKHYLLTFLHNSKDSQLIFTTHSTALMQDKELIRRDALWFTEKKDDGSIDLYSAADFDSSVLRKESNIYNAYKVGKLGAKPNLGSPMLTN